MPMYLHTCIHTECTYIPAYTLNVHTCLHAHWIYLHTGIHTEFFYTGAQSRLVLDAFEAARNRMDEVQHVQQCSETSRVSVVRLRGTNGHAGFASIVEQVCVHVRMYACMACLCACSGTRQTHGFVHAKIHRCKHTCIHTYTHIHITIHTYIHSYIHTYIGGRRTQQRRAHWDSTDSSRLLRLFLPQGLSKKTDDTRGNHVYVSAYASICIHAYE